MNTEMLCLAGCGFYASNNGYCSACSPTVEIHSAPCPSPLILGETQRAGNSSIELLQSLEESKEVNKEIGKQQHPQRCFLCDKKFGLIGFDCECKHTYCKLHRYAESHHCTYNFAEAGKQKLAKNNPLVQGTSLLDRL